MARNIIKIKNMFDDTLYGYSWTVKRPKANVLIMTGMQETAIRYDDFANFLNENHYDVYCIDHYGQGLNILKENDIKGVWPKNAFAKTVKTYGEIHDQLSLTGLPTYIFAHSMGSFMAQDYIQRFNRAVSKVVLCGSDYADPCLMSIAYKIAKFSMNKNNHDLPNKTLAKIVTGAFSKKVKDRKTDFDWLSYNEENVKKYIDDPKCGYTSTTGFYVEFLKGMSTIARKKYLHKIHKNISIFIISGSEDPVGHMGKGPRKLYKMYKKLGIDKLFINIYSRMRHEILNETHKDIVYKDVLKFFEL